MVKCANFVGDTIDLCVEHGFRQVLLVGHIGKFIKLAGGVMNTHSRTADCRAEILTAHAALHGAGADTARQLMEAATTDECIRILDACGLRQAVLGTVLPKIQHHLDRRAGGGLAIGAVLVKLSGNDPVEAYQTLFRGAFGSKQRISEVFVKMVPLCMMAFGTSVAFRAQLWNIGGNGQFILGAIAAILPGLYLKLPPVILHIGKGIYRESW